jgi:uroporphyrinogen-III synthase
MTIGDASVHFMRSKGKQQSTKAIAEGLKAGGIASESMNLYNTVYNTLTKRAERESSDVVKVGSEWALTEWQQQERSQV